MIRCLCNIIWRLCIIKTLVVRKEQHLLGSLTLFSADQRTCGLQDVDKYVKEKEELERDRLRMHAENDALQHKLEETEREQEHRYIHGTMSIKKEYEQKMEELRKRCGHATHSALQRTYEHCKC